MKEISTFRLYLLRAAYLLLVFGLGLNIWPLLLSSSRGVEHMRGVVWSMLAALSLVAVLGLRYPVRMLPLLFFELAWKAIWVVVIGLPLWSTNQLVGATRDTWTECLMGLIIFPLLIPWDYVFTQYVRQTGDRWRSSTAARLPSEAKVPLRTPGA